MKLAALTIFILIASRALAGSGSSASYGNTTDVIDAGGTTASSAGYSSHVSIGAIGSISTSSSFVNRGGFPGQLYEFANIIALFASSLSIAEDSTVQLSARRLLSDSTFVSIATGDVAWLVINGPLSPLGTPGLLQATPVHTTTNSTVRGTYLGMSSLIDISVLDTLPDNFGSYASDGLHDSWQVNFFGLDNPAAAPSLDPDGDSQTNQFEYLANTNPTDSNSLLELRIDRVEKDPGRFRLTLSPYYSKRTYRLQMRPSLSSGVSWKDAGIIEEGEDSGSYFFIHDGEGDPARFFRVQIVE